MNLAAFDSSLEANLVEALRGEVGPLVSLVAELDGRVVGHIMFSPVRLDGHPDARIMGLAPMSVIPSLQRQGVGSELVRIGLEQCLDLGTDGVVVLGHPSYYPRFGFVRADGFGIRTTYDVPSEAFMLLELKRDSLRGRSGTIHYSSAFDRATAD